MNISGNASVNSAGLLLGVQFFLNKKGSFVLDWWSVGAHYGKGKGDFTGRSSQTLTPDQQSTENRSRGFGNYTGLIFCID
ncbi:hypothetical protein ASG31_06170 [Chryseobacterium sp. Leaf404]|uniref:hypothetical protein n=1 Tax=unclassified Chryseobacterium TaxID=2593645 RepID=UPI00070122AD|nr:MULTISPECIES: hypothetical protein [unclassified Chryseobacterium]KQT18310.1 hypothetical protein ASG31_06170 [Chryseobacterium sp. Leaf404]